MLLPVGPWLHVQENPERGAFVSIRRDRLRNQEKPSCSLARPGISFKYGQLTNQIVPYDRPTNQIVPFVGEQDISKEQGLAAGVPSPLLPLPLRPTFVGTPAVQAMLPAAEPVDISRVMKQFCFAKRRCFNFENVL